MRTARLVWLMALASACGNGSDGAVLYVEVVAEPEAAGELTSLVILSTSSELRGGDDFFCAPILDVIDPEGLPYRIAFHRGAHFSELFAFRLEARTIDDELIRHEALRQWPEAGERRIEVTIDEACLRAGCGGSQYCDAGRCYELLDPPRFDELLVEELEPCEEE